MFGRIFITFLLTFTGVQVAHAKTGLEEPREAQTRPIGSIAPVSFLDVLGRKLPEAVADAMFIDVPIAGLLWGLGLGGIGGIPLGLATGTVGYGIRKICNDYLNQENTGYMGAVCGVLGGGVKGVLKGGILYDPVDMAVKSPLNAALYEGLPLEIGVGGVSVRTVLIELSVAFVGHRLTQDPQKTLAEELKGTATIALFVEASIHTLHTWYSKPLVALLKGESQVDEKAEKPNADL
ncbi:MAG: hypothetical protein JKY15_00660 [Deltaproteobacteria bacterium]|nr:hypothetical protein [Deltaproteobacteria bacterium]